MSSTLTADSSADPGAAAAAVASPPLQRRRDRLSTRIVTTTLLALITVAAMIGWTLWLSWNLEGAAAAINDTGSLRMRANGIGVALLQGEASTPQARQGRDDVEATLARLERGVPARPLFLPSDSQIQQQFHRVVQLWQQQMQPDLARALAGQGGGAYLASLPGFVAEADRLVRLIEADNTRKTSLLRLSQAALLLLASCGTLTMIYLLYLWILAPVQQLQGGLQRMSQRQFDVRLPVESRDEFGELAVGFNRMADELSGLYLGLEARVAEKTRQLATQNRELEALFGMAEFLNQSMDIEALCRGFLARVQRQFGAEGGSIRVIDPEGDKLHLVVSTGLDDGLTEREHCMPVDACLCGRATQQGVVVIRDFRQMPRAPSVEFPCQKSGFASLAVFRIVMANEVLGSFSLHFRTTRDVTPSEAQMLETLGQQLGVALDNRRLGAKARQLAVAQERQLLAQGLHDSIAQGLNFLNLQVQMLDGAARDGRLDEISEIVPLLRTGVEESYQDVRELLSNFRSRLEQGELADGLRDTVERFRRQTGLSVALDIDGDGAPLPPEQQLQVLFILQEALSNIRKHAQAHTVRVRVVNGRDFELSIRDDGQGYDPLEVAQRDESHVGMTIMHERARRIRAHLTLISQPQQGCEVHLLLPAHARQTA
ncbi:type IV pili methyl-accepting chemotaxis transducer N-terminal domain-containing protein [Amphibiibacter pelophylacis]|uniref:Type IV pili methyl-accepting chemotaxis transducer N-terminal domain-containing protein n=1 Tax=Amphibiibacter pelophylacis TaxID=1799477 RepID=A0ACC6P1B5_9BURK